MPPSPLAKLRKLCLALPEAQEVEAWGEPTFRVRGKLFAMYASAGSHHTEGRPAVWLKAAPGNQAFMVAYRPTRFFTPPYVGTSGWVGVWLDAADWDELRELVADAWRLTAPKRLAAQLPETASDAAPARTPPTKARAKTPRAKKAVAKKASAKKAPAKKASARKR